MAKSNSLTAAYEALPKILKILIQLILGAAVGGIFRIVLTEGISYGWIAFAMMIAVIVVHTVCSIYFKDTPEQNTKPANNTERQ